MHQPILRQDLATGPLRQEREVTKETVLTKTFAQSNAAFLVGKVIRRFLLEPFPKLRRQKAIRVALGNSREKGGIVRIGELVKPYEKIADNIIQPEQVLTDNTLFREGCRKDGLSVIDQGSNCFD